MLVDFGVIVGFVFVWLGGIGIGVGSVHEFFESRFSDVEYGVWNGDCFAGEIRDDAEGGYRSVEYSAVEFAYDVCASEVSETRSSGLGNAGNHDHRT